MGVAGPWGYIHFQPYKIAKTDYFSQLVYSDHMCILKQIQVIVFVVCVPVSRTVKQIICNATVAQKLELLIMLTDFGQGAEVSKGPQLNKAKTGSGIIQRLVHSHFW